MVVIIIGSCRRGECNGWTWVSGPGTDTMYCKSPADNKDKRLFSSSPQAAPLSFQVLRNKDHTQGSPAASRQRAAMKKISQKRIGFLHSNENSSCEMDETEGKQFHTCNNEIKFGEQVYIPQVKKQTKSRLPRMSLTGRNSLFKTSNKIKCADYMITSCKKYAI